MTHDHQEWMEWMEREGRIDELLDMHATLTQLSRAIDGGAARWLVMVGYYWDISSLGYERQEIDRAVTMVEYLNHFVMDLVRDELLEVLREG